jgi:hypothetical protein
MLRGKFISVRANIKKKKINNLMVQLKLLEKQEQSKPQNSRWREIIKINTEINEMETKKLIQRINETKS